MELKISGLKDTLLLTIVAIPPKPVDLRYTQDPFNTIKLYWNMSQTVDVNHTRLKFRVKCKQYFGISVQVPCRNLSLGARGQNVTSSPLEVKNLFNNTNYTFSVTALNEVSYRFKEEEWKAATIAVYLQGNIVQATLPQTGTEYDPFNGQDTSCSYQD